MPPLTIVCPCSKHAEFALWAADVRKVDVGLLPKLEEKELFRSFMEDFNTGTPTAQQSVTTHSVRPQPRALGSHA